MAGKDAKDAKRNSIVFYRSYFDTVEEFDEETQADFFRAYFMYAFYGEDITADISKFAAGLFGMARDNIDRAMERYDLSVKRSESGKLGGRPKKGAQTPPEKQTESKPKANEKQNESKSKANGKQTESIYVYVDDDEYVDENEYVDDDGDENENDMSLTSTSNGETESKGGVGENLDETGMLTVSRVAPQVPDESAMRAFMDKYNIEFDNYNADFSGMDFDLLSHAYSKSPEFLQVDEQARWMSWVCRHYREIVRGYYDKRFAPKKAGEEVDDILTTMLAEDYAKEGKNGRG